METRRDRPTANWDFLTAYRPAERPPMRVAETTWPAIEESARYLEDARALKTVLLDRGYSLGENLACWEVDGAAHSEAAWGSRASMALMYLLGGQREVSDVAA